MKLHKVTLRYFGTGCDSYIATRGCFRDGTHNMGHYNHTMDKILHVNLKRRMYLSWKMTYWANNVAVGWSGVDEEEP